MAISPPDNTPLYRSADAYLRTMSLYDRMLGQITVPHTTSYVETQAGATHVIQAGPQEAPPVFLLHGMSANAVTWVPQINMLAREYRVYAADMPGGMGKSAPTRIERTGGAYGRWLANVMDGLQIPAASVIGISFGGWLALKLASVGPDRIVSAMLISSAGFVPQSNKILLKMLPRLVLMPIVSLERRAQMFLDVMGAPGYQPTSEEVELFGLLLGYFKYDQRAPDPCTDAELACLTAPTTLVYGEYEAAFDSAAAIQRARQRLPNLVHCAIVPGVGHGMTGEDTPRVNGLLLDFLKGSARPNG
jgi:2-hydroxy-6-oxonona-2,4-dienedioate hydrolase